MKRVLLIDPWGIANTSEYLNGLIYGLSSIVDLTVFTNYYFELKTDSNVRINRVFFKKTEKMHRNKIRSVIRGMEYIIAYFRIFTHLLRTERYDVIHINWLLEYSLDVHFLKHIKKYTNKVVYTAHNVIPHVNGEKYIPQLRVIYGMCDRIIFHGEAIKKEFIKYFSEFENKVYIQYHGNNLFPSTAYDENKIPEYIKKKVLQYNRMYIYFGVIFFNKGVDLLVKCWLKSTCNKKSLLVLVGKRDGDYPELDQMIGEINNSDNILYINGFVDNDVLNYLIEKSIMVLLPYRHASMSGVVFTAADFKKPILCTNVGAIPEYIENGVDSICVECSEEKLLEALKMVDESFDEKMLHEMGVKLFQNIQNKCSWPIITRKLEQEVY